MNLPVVAAVGACGSVVGRGTLHYKLEDYEFDSR
jgi:hypothetical protein